MAELVPIPGLDLIGAEATEELLADGYNAAFDPKKRLQGSSILAATKKLTGAHRVIMRAAPTQLDAEGKLIFIEDPISTRMPIDALRVAHPNLPPRQYDQPLITKEEQAYMDSVAKKLANDPKLNEIIGDLRKVFESSAGNNTFEEGSVLDKRLESRGVNTKSWTRL